MLSRFMLLCMLAGLAFGVLVAVVGVHFYFPYRPLTGHAGPLPDSTPEEEALAVVLREHVVAVASEPHNTAHPEALEASARYIERHLYRLGYAVERQEYLADDQMVRNIHVSISGHGAGRQSFVVGAHYDSAGLAPGANDNGSGVAVLLELARLLKDHKPGRHLMRLVFFVNEEPPHFLTETMGSAHFARWLVAREKVRAMISLETLGSYFDQPGTQSFPPPFGLVYGSTGNFVAFVGTTRARHFVHEAIASFRRHAQFPSIGGVAPAFVPGIDWSDHASFGDYGVSALMITDTAPFRYLHYHKRTDTPEKIDYDRLARVTKGIERMLRDIAN